MSKTTDFLAAIGAERPKRYSADKRHGGGNEDRLYHGPLRISEEEVFLCANGHIYRTKEGKAAISTKDENGIGYVWRCAPATGDFLGALYRLPAGGYRVYLYKPATVDWRGEPRTVANRIARFAPDPTIPQVTIEQERAYFLGEGAPLMPPIATPVTPLWQQDQDVDISQYITPILPLIDEEPAA